MPADWTPDRGDATTGCEALARDRGIDLHAEMLRMRDWAAAHGAHRADWNAAWRNWIRNAHAQQRTQRPNGQVGRIDPTHETHSQGDLKI